jgi:branched-chain amino acid transport system substrate-binding protein
MTSYDAANLLDHAISAAGANPTPQQIDAAIGAVGPISSPRGTWQFNPTDHTPVQTWYLRKVETPGGTPTNVTVQTHGPIG